MGVAGVGAGTIFGGKKAFAPDGAPSALTLTVDSDTAITLNWTIGSTNHDGHRIYISTDGVTFTEKGTVTGATATYNAEGLTAGTLYYFYVVAYNVGGESVATNVVYIMTEPDQIRDGNTVAWYDSSDLTTITKDGSDRVSLWKDKLLHSGIGAELTNNWDNEVAKATVSAIRCATAQSNEQAYAGTYSSKVTHSADVGVHYLTKEVTAGNNYTVSVWVWIPSGQAHIDSVTLGEGGAGSLATTNLKDQWVELSTVHTATSNNYSLASGNSDSNGEYYYFDNFSVRETVVTPDLIQATANKQPTWSTEGVYFSGTDEFMKSKSFPLVQPISIYAVIKHINTAVTGNRFFDGYIPNSVFLSLEAPLPDVNNYINLNAPTRLGKIYIGGDTYHIVRFVANGASSSIRIDGYNATTGAGGASNANGFTLGSRADGLLSFCNFYAKEIIIRAVVDDAADDTAIYNYLSYKYAEDIALVGNFNDYAGNPILSPSGSEVNQATWGSVLKVDSTYHMYYHTTIPPYIYVMHATSSDGKTWVKDDVNNPVLSPGLVTDWDSNGAGVPFVWKEGATWYMLYRGNGAPPVGNDAMGLATSVDGLTWTKSASNPVLAGTLGEWDGGVSGGAESGGIIKVGSTYYTYYEALTPSNNRCIGIATSTDLITWTKDPANPIFTHGRFCPFVFKYGGKYYIIVPHYTDASNDYSEFELYRDNNPTFYVADREFLGVIKRAGVSGWNSHDQDTPHILTDDVYRDTFNASNGEIWCYYAGEEGGVWKQGLMISTDFDV